VKEINAQTFIPVSAKTGNNLKKVFDQAVAIVLQHRRELGEDEVPSSSGGGSSNTGGGGSSGGGGGGEEGIVFKPSTQRSGRGGCVVL